MIIEPLSDWPLDEIPQNVQMELFGREQCDQIGRFSGNFLKPLATICLPLCIWDLNQGSETGGCD